MVGPAAHQYLSTVYIFINARGNVYKQYWRIDCNFCVLFHINSNFVNHPTMMCTEGTYFVCVCVCIRPTNLWYENFCL